MSKILVTGAAGFIGFHIVQKLLKENCYVIGLDNLNEYYDVNLKRDRLKECGIYKVPGYDSLIQSDLYNKYQFIRLELHDKLPLLSLYRDQKFDYVIHLAAQAGVRYSLTNPEAYIDSNLHGFLNVLEACRYQSVKHLLYASSSSVYGINKKTPFSETDSTDHPVSLYAATKRANELFAHTYSHLFNIPCTGLRFFTVYGPWGRPDMAYFNFVSSIIEGKPIKVFNNGNMLRDFTFIDDIVDSILNLLELVPVAGSSNNEFCDSDAPCTIFNIGANSPVKLLDFIKEIEQAIGKSAYLEYLPMQPGDVPVTYADVRKLEMTTKNVGKVFLQEGISKFVAWYKTYYNINSHEKSKEVQEATYVSQSSYV